MHWVKRGAVAAFVCGALMFLIASCGSTGPSGVDAVVIEAIDTDSLSTSEPVEAAAATPTPEVAPSPYLVGEAPSWRYSTTTIEGQQENDTLTVEMPIFEGGTFQDALNSPLLPSFFETITADFHASAGENPELETDSTVTGTVLFSSPGMVSVIYHATLDTASMPREVTYHAFIFDLIEQRFVLPDELFVDAAAQERVGDLMLGLVVQKYGIEREDLDLSAWDDGFASVVPTPAGLRIAFGRGRMVSDLFANGAVVEIPWGRLHGLIRAEIIDLRDAPHGVEIVESDLGLPSVEGTATSLEPALPFGTPTDDVLNTLSILLGPSTGDTDFTAPANLCPDATAAAIRVVTWGDVDVVFSQEAGLVGWFVTNRGFGNGSNFTEQGIGIDSSVELLTAAYETAFAEPSSTDTDEEVFFQAVLDSAAIGGTVNDGVVTNLWAGLRCELPEPQ
jgi:hypothetical protein